VSGRIAEFRDQGCDVLGVSTDSVETHERWIGTPEGGGGLGGLSFPLAADEDGAACRAYQVVHSLTVGRSVEEVLEDAVGVDEEEPEPFGSMLRAALAVVPSQRRIAMAQIAGLLA
jgi:hypothetical protein